jgi:hypothetical protein
VTLIALMTICLPPLARIRPNDGRTGLPLLTAAVKYANMAAVKVITARMRAVGLSINPVSCGAAPPGKDVGSPTLHLALVAGHRGQGTALAILDHLLKMMT